MAVVSNQSMVSVTSPSAIGPDAARFVVPIRFVCDPVALLDDIE